MNCHKNCKKCTSFGYLNKDSLLSNISIDDLIENAGVSVPSLDDFDPIN